MYPFIRRMGPPPVLVPGFAPQGVLMPQSMSNTLFNDAQARAAQLQLQAAAATSGPAPELGSDGTMTYISG